MLTVLGGLAEFERDLIRARTYEGRGRAKVRGVELGSASRLFTRTCLECNDGQQELTILARLPWRII
jgi:DNA invertase Pin-like site-specific DNA recombinase